MRCEGLRMLMCEGVRVLVLVVRVCEGWAVV